MRWIWDGGFLAYRTRDDGVHEVKKFTSSAQARQFVEQAENILLAAPAVPDRGNRRQRQTTLTEEQQRELKQKASQQLKGL